MAAPATPAPPTAAPLCGGPTSHTTPHPPPHPPAPNRRSISRPVNRTITQSFADAISTPRAALLEALLANAAPGDNLTELRLAAAYFQPAPWPVFKLLLDPVPQPPAFNIYGAAIAVGSLLLAAAYYLSTSIRREHALRCGAPAAAAAAAPAARLARPP